MRLHFHKPPTPNGSAIVGVPLLDWLSGLLAVAVVVIAATGFWALERLHTSERARIGNTLESILDTSHRAFLLWTEGRIMVAANEAERREVVAVVERMVAEAERELVVSPALVEGLHRMLRHEMGETDFLGFFVADLEQQVIAATHGSGIAAGDRLPVSRERFRRAVAGGETFSLPVEELGRFGMLFALSPVHDEQGTVIAVLTFCFSVDERLMSIARLDNWGENENTYFFDYRGRLLEAPADPVEGGMDGGELPVTELRDPGGDTTRGYRPELPPERRPFTRMAQSALRGESAVDLDGYRDHRGVPVVGAWHAHEDGMMGMAAEIPRHEAFRVYLATRDLLVTAMAVATLLLGVLIVLSLRGRQRAQRLAREATRELRRRNRELEESGERTERMVEALREAHQRFSLAMRGAQDGMWDWNLLNDHVYYSPRWAAMLGYSTDDLEPEFSTWRRLVHPEDQARVLERVRAVAEAGRSHFSAEYRMRHKDGHWVEVLSRAIAVHDADSRRTVRLVGTHVDITERKHYQRAIDYENRLHAVLRDLLRIPLVGRPLEACLGEALDILLQAPFAALLPQGALFLNRGDHLEMVVERNLGEPLVQLCRRVSMNHCLCGTAAAEQRLVFADRVDDRHHIRFPGMAPHGHYSLPILSRGRTLGVLVLYLPEGHQRDQQEVRFLEAAALVLASMIEQKRGERDLIDAKEQAEAANRAKTEFLANMSHELRTPMHAILSFAAIGREKAGDVTAKRVRHYFERIQGGGERLLKLLNDLLDLSKLEAGRMEFEVADEQLERLVKVAVEELAGITRDKGQRVVVEPPSGATDLRCDGFRVVQVLRNLLGNALKFTADGGEIHLRFAHRELADGTPAIGVSVIDQGMGVPADELESIFDKFVQSSITNTGAGGTGLGLAISRQIARGHGGDVLVENNQGVGATFTLLLPTAEPSVEAMMVGARRGGERLEEKR